MVRRAADQCRYHWSVEYFEDLRNVNHCEFVIMRQNLDSGKYILESQLRTWSDLKRERAKERAEEAKNNPSRRNTLSSFLKKPNQASPDIKPRQWGGCVGGCDHHHERYPRRELKDIGLPPAAEAVNNDKNEADDHPLGDKDAVPTDGTAEAMRSHLRNLSSASSIPSYLRSGRDGGGTDSGFNTPHDMSDEEAEYFKTTGSSSAQKPGGSLKAALKRAPQRKATEEDFERWASESGMGQGKHADALGDESPYDDDAVAEAERQDKSLTGSVY